MENLRLRHGCHSNGEQEVIGLVLLKLAFPPKVCILHIMQKASATSVARKFSEFLGKVKDGRSIQVLKHGRVVARLVPDCDFIEGKRAADLFRDHVADPAAADAIARELAQLREDEANALAH